MCCGLAVIILLLLGLVVAPSFTCFLPLGINGVPLGYTTASLLNGKMPDKYTCGQRIWTAVTNATVIVEYGSQVPAKQWSGEWWRGNELGFVINNPAFWSGTGIWPQTNVIGFLPSQHSALRPFLDDAFKVHQGNRDQVKSLVRDSLKSFFAQRKMAGELKVSGDLTAWMHQFLMKISFGQEVNFSNALDFVALQNKVIKLGSMSQLFLPFLYGFLPTSAVTDEISKYMKYVEDRWGANLTDIDCSPSPNCSILLASGLWDTIYSAGGLSVPQGLATGLGVLYSTSDSNPVKNFTIPPGKEEEFFWENMRFFPPVWGFPYWQPRPTCYSSTAEETAKLSLTDGQTKACEKEKGGWFAPFPPVNQFAGGKRIVLDLPSAQWDKSRWGEDAGNFTLYTLEEYDKKSVGFAEMAADDTVANGNMDRVCPGRELAIIIGTIFFEEFDQHAWEPDDSDIGLDQRGTSTPVASFVLRPKS